MKIVFIHGEDLQKARERFYQIIEYVKNKSREVKNITLDQSLGLTEVLTGQSLFEEDTLYTVSETKKIPLKKITWLFKNSNKFSKDILFLYEGIAPASILKLLPKSSKLEKYDLPKIIFKFLESFYPKNSKEVLTLLNKLAESEALEFVFALLAKHLRDLYWVLLESDLPDYPSWRIAKLKSQAKKFSQSSLVKIIDLLAEIDIKVKTSQTSLKESLDLVIISKLE